MSAVGCVERLTNKTIRYKGFEGISSIAKKKRAQATEAEIDRKRKKIGELNEYVILWDNLQANSMQALIARNKHKKEEDKAQEKIFSPFIIATSGNSIIYVIYRKKTIFFCLSK